MIHQICITPDMPEQLRTYHNKILAVQGTDNVRLWNENDCIELAEEYGIINRWLAYPHWIYRADVSRMLILHKYGGWYCDLDIELKQPLPDPPEKPDKMILINGSALGEPSLPIDICVMYAPIGHIALERYITRLPHYSKRLDVLYDTGAMKLYRCLFGSPVRIWDVDTWARYGIHHHEKSWQKVET